jgi:hypothetical protein
MTLKQTKVISEIDKESCLVTLKEEENCSLELSVTNDGFLSFVNGTSPRIRFVVSRLAFCATGAREQRRHEPWPDYESLSVTYCGGVFCWGGPFRWEQYTFSLFDLFSRIFFSFCRKR